MKELTKHVYVDDDGDSFIFRVYIGPEGEIGGVISVANASGSAAVALPVSELMALHRKLSSIQVPIPTTMTDQDITLAVEQLLEDVRID